MIRRGKSYPQPRLAAVRGAKIRFHAVSSADPRLRRLRDLPSTARLPLSRRARAGSRAAARRVDELSRPSCSALSCAAAAAAIALLRLHARRLPQATPNARSLHEGDVPRAGGLAILAGVLRGRRSLAPPPVPGSAWVWLAAVARGRAVSFADDVRGVPAALPRLLVQLAAALVVAEQLADVDGRRRWSRWRSRSRSSGARTSSTSWTAATASRRRWRSSVSRAYARRRGACGRIRGYRTPRSPSPRCRSCSSTGRARRCSWATSARCRSGSSRPRSASRVSRSDVARVVSRAGVPALRGRRHADARGARAARRAGLARAPLALLSAAQRAWRGHRGTLAIYARPDAGMRRVGARVPGPRPAAGTLALGGCDRGARSRGSR